MKGIKLSDFSPEWQKKIRDQAASQVSHDKQHSGDGAKTKVKAKAYMQRARLHIHSKRHRLCDPDGLYPKHFIDSAVRGGVLVDDSADYISQVTFSQEKSDVEETILTFTEEN